MLTNLLVTLAIAQATVAPLTPGKVYDAPKPGKFDVIAFDRKFHRVLAAHTGASSLAVLDTTTGKIDEIETGEINGVAVANKSNKIFVGGGGNKLVVLDRESLKVLSSIDLTGPADVIAVDTKRQQVYVSHDDGTEDWVFDADTLKLLGSVAIEEAPEFIEYDSTRDQIFQNIKSSDHVQVINPETRKVIATWATEPMKSPHGIALDKKGGRIFSAGKNGKLVVLDMTTGKSLASLEIGAGTDQIAFDASLSRLYVPGGDKITVIDTTGEPKVIGTVAIPKGARSITVDTTTHDVWVCYGDAQSAHFAQFKTSN